MGILKDDDLKPLMVSSSPGLRPFRMWTACWRIWRPPQFRESPNVEGIFERWPLEKLKG